MKSQSRLRTGMIGSRQTSSIETPKLFSRTRLDNTRLRVISPKSTPMNPQRVEKTPTSSIFAEHSHKAASIFLRNFVYRYMRRSLSVVKNVLPRPRPSFSLINAKRKRLIHSCFLSIFSFSSSSQFSKLSKRNAHNPTAKILAKVYNILENKTKKVLFMAWNQHKKHENLGKNLAKITEEIGRRAIKRYWLIQAFGKIKIQAVKVWQRGQLLKQFTKIIASKDKKVLRQEFTQIPLQILMQSCQQAQVQLREKQQALVLQGKNKKETLYKMREQMKSIRITVEQAKNAKNSEQKNKDKHINKVTVVQEAKNLDTKIKETIIAIESQKIELSTKESQVAFRYQLRYRSDCAESVCFEFIRILKEHNQKSIKLAVFEHLVPSNLMKAFTESVGYLQMSNSLLQAQVNFYENGDNPTQEADYYELYYENKVLKELVSCLVRQEYSNYKYSVAPK